MHLEGTPSDDLPEVLATGRSDIGYAFISLSGREPNRRDAEYIEWHSLDHRPEQYRLDGIRKALRLVSTPQCRAARRASEGMFNSVDHVMTYMFTSAASIPAFGELGAALDRGGRMALRLPSVGYITGNFAGKLAAPHAVAGADVIPWRPALGVYLLVEEGASDPAALLDVPGVAGIWWFDGAQGAAPFDSDWRGKRVTYCFLDRDPVEVAAAMAPGLRERWASGETRALLAAPFHTIANFDWGRHLPH